MQKNATLADDANAQQLRRIEFVEAVKALEEELGAFCAYVRRQAGPLWEWEEQSRPLDKADFTPDRRRAASLEAICKVIRSTSYVDDQDSSETARLPSMVVLPPEGLAQAQAINALKLRVECAWKAIKEDLVQSRKHELPVSLRDELLELCRLPRYHYKQAVRQFSVILTTPLSVTFFWHPNPLLTPVTCGQLRKQLLEGYVDSPARQALAGWATDPQALMMMRDAYPTVNPAVLKDLARLARLPDDEPLQRERSIQLQARARIRWRDAQGQTQTIAKACASLPILIAGWPPGKKFKPLTPKPSLQEALDRRIERVDTLTESDSYLETICVYRYLDPQAERMRRQRKAAAQLAVAEEQSAAVH